MITAPLLLLLSSFLGAGEAAELSHAADLTLAQAGSTGGTLGNDDKSVSGTQAAPATRTQPVMRKPAKAEPARTLASPRPAPPVAPAAAAKPLKRQVREAGPSLAAFDGDWTGASTGACIPRWRWSFTVINGIMTGDSGSNISGRIRPDGDTAGKMTVFGSTYDFTGRMSATRVSGSWVKLGEEACTGTWSATK